MTISELPVCLTIKDISNFMQIGMNNAHKVVNSKGFPKIKVGRRTVIPTESFLEWLKKKSEEDMN